MFGTDNNQITTLNKESTSLINDLTEDENKELIALRKKMEYKNSIVLNNRNYNYKISNLGFTDVTSGDFVYHCCGWWLCNLLGKKKDHIKYFCNKTIMGNISKMVNLQGHDCVYNLQSIEYKWGVSSGHYVLPCNMFKIEFMNSENCILIEYNKPQDFFGFYYYPDDVIILNFIRDILKN